MRKVVSFITVIALLISVFPVSVFAIGSNYLNEKLYPGIGVVKSNQSLPESYYLTEGYGSDNEYYQMYYVDCSDDDFIELFVIGSLLMNDYEPQKYAYLDTNTYIFDVQSHYLLHITRYTLDYMANHFLEDYQNMIDQNETVLSTMRKIWLKANASKTFNDYWNMVIHSENQEYDYLEVVYSKQGYSLYHDTSSNVFLLEYDSQSGVSKPSSFTSRTKIVYRTNDSSEYYGGGTTQNIDDNSAHIYTDTNNGTVIGQQTIYDITQGSVTQEPVLNNNTGNSYVESFNIASNSTITISGDNSVLYDLSAKQYTINYTTNVVYTVNNYNSYYQYNYYMAGSDVPFSIYNAYEELPDGRNTYTMTREELNGLNTGFDVINYETYTTDPYQQALFHFDGVVDNSGAYNPPQKVNYTYNFPSQQDFLVDSRCPEPFHGGYIDFYFTVYFSRSATVYFQYSIDNGNSWVNVYSYAPPWGGTEYTVHVTSSSVPVGAIMRIYYNFIGGGSILLYASSFSSSSWGYSDRVYPNLNNPTQFVFDDNPSYTFVKTGEENFKAALYLDGLSHDAHIDLVTGSIISGFDYTYSFRFYQELSSSSAINYVYIGKNGSIYDSYLEWNGYQFGSLGNRGATVNISETIPVGTWNTITITRANNTIYFFLNGNLIQSLSNSNSFDVLTLSDHIYLHFGEDNNVKYIDEIMFTDLCLYTGNHVPRLQPYDTSNVLVQPRTITQGSYIAIHSSLPVTVYQVGGSRPSYPIKGFTYIYLDNNKVKSIQQYNGYIWVEVDTGSVFYKGSWYSLDTYNIIEKQNEYDVGEPGVSVTVNSKTTIWDFLTNLFSPITNLLNTIADGVGNVLNSTISSIITPVIDFIGSLVGDTIGIAKSFIESIIDFFGDLSDFFDSSGVSTSDIKGGYVNEFFAFIPSKFYSFISFILLILVAVSVIDKFRS